MKASGLDAAVARIRALAAGLRSVASGEFSARVGAAVAEDLVAAAKAAAGDHVETGRALSSLTVTSDGGAIRLDAAGYLRFHRWWPFREGIPAEMVTAARVRLADEVARVLGRAG